jgi:hypothetical protein
MAKVPVGGSLPDVEAEHESLVRLNHSERQKVAPLLEGKDEKRA